MNQEEILQDALTDPSFDALTIELAEPFKTEPAAAARDALAFALAAVVQTTDEGWQVVPVHPSAPGAFDLLPPANHTISVSQAFDLKYALQSQPQVRVADALFETKLDNYPEPPEQPPDDDTPVESFDVDWFAQLSLVERNPLWSLGQIQADQVWSRTEGAGILVGHPDSGYIGHDELDDGRIRHDLERDFYDGDSVALNETDFGGNHGLSTASVILSGPGRLGAERFVAGVAPAAELLPMRITRKGPPVFLFQSGPRRVRDAIYHAIDSGADLISMSLGGIGDRSLHRAIQEAVDRGLIVLAAAGNGVPFVVWPARYPETIAVAACDADRRPWTLSSRGSTVDISAPGHNVWRAYINEDGRAAAKPSSGTSYATATMAGVAALWLAFHRAEAPREKYQTAGVPLNTVFRRLLADSADPPPVGHGGNFGAGIVNVRRLLETPLPDPQEFAPPPFEHAETVEAAQTPVETVASVFDTVPEQQVQQRLTDVTNMPAAELNPSLSGVEDELIFHLVTNKELRGLMVSPVLDDPAHESLAPTPDLEDLSTLSNSFRARLAG